MLTSFVYEIEGNTVSFARGEKPQTVIVASSKVIDTYDCSTEQNTHRTAQSLFIRHCGQTKTTYDRGELVRLLSMLTPVQL